MAEKPSPPSGKGTCAVCKKDIASVRIECTVCKGVSLCIECFASGSEAPELGHANNHSYKIHENLASFNLFDKDWSAEDELLLLQGIDMYGMGNWREISTLVGTKSEGACYRHYMACYLHSRTAPMPSGDPTVTATYKPPMWASSGSNVDGSASSAAAAGAGAEGSSSSSSAAAAGGAGAGSSGSGRSGAGGAGTPGYSHAHIPKTEVAGYLPLRGDFDVEHDNDAEAILADMEFTEGEHATETELKLKVLEIYNARLDERERRKAFVIERGLLDYKRLLAVERRRPKEEREVYDAFRPFARFMSPQEHEELVRGIILESRLRKRIAQLQEYRKAGIRSLAEAQEYEAARRKREASGGPGAGGRRAAAAAASASSGGYMGESLSAPSSSSAAAAAAGSASSSGAGQDVRSARYNRGRGAGGDADGTPSALAAGSEGISADLDSSSAAKSKRRRKGDNVEDAGEGDDSMGIDAGASGVGHSGKASTGKGAVSSSSSSSAPAFSLEGVPGAERLTSEERRLCEHLRLLPGQYQQIKATIVNVSLARGHVRRDDASGLLVHVDVAKVNQVYDFVVSAGWARPALGEEVS